MRVGSSFSTSSQKGFPVSKNHLSAASLLLALAGGMLSPSSASGQVLASFENSLSSSTGVNWEGDWTASPQYTTVGATEGTSAWAISHGTGWSFGAILKAGIPLAQLVAAHDFMLIDVTTTDVGVAGDGWSPAWRQVIPIFNASQGGWQQNSFDVGVAGDDGGSLTETVILDLATTGIKANAQAYLDTNGDYWELFIAMQGGNQGVVQAGNYATADGGVNAADYTTYRDELGATVLANETVTLGIVDPADYDEWKLNFGNDYSRITTIIDNIRFANASAASVSAAAVPEPASVLLTLGTVVGMALVRRRAR